MNYHFDSNGYYDDDIEDALFENDDDAYDDDAYDDDAYDDDALGENDDDASERRKGRRRTRDARGAKGRRMRPGQTKPYRGTATMNTPAGQAKVKLPPDLVSKKEFKALEAKVVAINDGNIKNGKAIDVLNGNTKKLEARLDKMAADNKKQFEGIRQGQMMGAFIQPSLTSFTPAGSTTPTTVASSSFDSSSAMLPMLFSSMGSGGGSNDMMMPMMMMAMNQGGGSGNDNSMMFMMMAMMMGNK
jgi:hypothetical protein